MKIDIVQAATNLAQQDLESLALSMIPSEIGKPGVDKLVGEILFDENGNFEEEYQKVFNDSYDYSFEMISNCIVEE